MTPLSDVIDERKALIFRITHRDNVPYLLAHGVHCRAASSVDPGFVEIGNPEIIDKRRARMVRDGPRGTLADYVPFYFTPRTPMLYNIVSGYRGLRQRARSEIVVIASSLNTLEAASLEYVVADRNATLLNASIKAGRTLLSELPWELWKAHDFQRDPNDPEKVERYQAEALVHRHLPASAITAIITYDPATQATVRQQVSDADLEIPVYVQSSWYP